MSNVIATAPPKTAFNAAGPTTAIAVLDANPALANLDPGSLVRGTVLGRDARGQIVLETEYGQITLATRLNLSIGSNVVLQLQSAGARLSAIILAVDDQPVTAQGRADLPLPSQAQTPGAGIASTAAQRLPIPTQAATATAPAALQVTLTTGSIVTAIVLRTIQRPVASAPNAPAPQTPREPIAVEGSTLTVRIVAIEPPANADNALDAGIVQVTAPLPPDSPALPTLPSQPSSPATATEPIPPAIEPPALAAPQAPTIAPETPETPQLIGVVLGTGLGGKVALRVPFGVIELSLPTALPVGSLVTLEQLSVPKTPALPHFGGHAPSTNAPADFIRDWPAVRQLVALLAEQPERNGAVPHPNLPRVGPEFALGLIAFAAALESGDSEGWLTPPLTQALSEQGHDSAVAQLRGDFNQLSQLASPRGTTDWRAFIIPIETQRSLQQISLYVRREEERRQPAAADAKVEAFGHRFVVELELSRLGALQLDGLLKGRRLNLILRSHGTLASDLRATLMTGFDDAAAAAGLTGALVFQDKLAHFPVTPRESFRGKAGAVVV